MAIKKIIVCDCCGKELKNSNNFTFNSAYFTDGAGSRDYNQVEIQLCEACLKDIRNSLKTIAERSDKL